MTTTITITATAHPDDLYDAIVDGLENAGIYNYEINDSSSSTAAVAPVAHDVRGQDLAALAGTGQQAALRLPTLDEWED